MRSCRWWSLTHTPRPGRQRIRAGRASPPRQWRRFSNRSSERAPRPLPPAPARRTRTWGEKSAGTLCCATAPRLFQPTLDNHPRGGSAHHVARLELARFAAGKSHDDPVVVHFVHGAAAVLRHAHRVALFQPRLGFDPQRPRDRVAPALDAVVARAALRVAVDFLAEVPEDHLPAALRAARVGGHLLDLAAF